MKIIHDDFVPGRKGGAWVVKKGQFIKVTDVDGGAIGDFVTFNANNLKERLDQGRTKADNGKFLISKGDHLYTRDNNVLLTIVEDTYGIHDLQYGMCSAWIFEQYHQRKADGNYHGFTNRFTVGGPMGVPPFGCYEVLQEALKDYPIAPEDIPDPLNLFQTMWFDFETGTLGIEDGRSKPGDYIVFEAKMDTLCGLSACPSTGRPFKVVVYES